MKIPANKRARPTPQATTEEAPKKSKAPKVILTVVILIGIAVGGGLFAKSYHERQQRAAYEAEVRSIESQADGIVKAVSTALSAKAPTTWVYDRDENLVMTLKVSDAMQAVDTVPAQLEEVIRAQANGDVPGLVVTEYLSSVGITPNDKVCEGYRRKLMSLYSEADLVRYLATTSMFGSGYVGAVNAAQNYFGTTLSQLGEDQLAFLAYTYRNTDVNIQSYLDGVGTTEERLGLILNHSEYTAIRSKIISELESISGVDVRAQSYMVKLTTSTQQQSILQSLVDSNMRQLIELNSDGTWALDCSIAVADRSTGFLRALVTGRRCTTSTGATFAMNTMSFRDNFAALYQELSDTSTFGFALREVAQPNGDTVLRSIRELFYSWSLAEPKTIDNVDPLIMLRSMYSMSSSTGEVSLVYQVTDTSGMTLYRATGNKVLDLDNDNLCQFFSDGTNDLTWFGGDFDIDTGVISFYSTADYIVVILAGSGALGGTVSSDARTRLHSVVEQVKSTVAGFYPTPTHPVWNGAGMSDAMVSCYEANQGYVADMFTDKLNKLAEMPITSSSERMTWEAFYLEITNFINEYEEFVGNTYADSLRAQQQQLRLERSELLIQYSV